MKKLILLVGAVLAVASVNAQTLSWGAKAGVNFSTMDLGMENTSIKVNPGTSTGFYVGLVGNYEITEKVGLQLEVNYSYGGAKLSMEGDFARNVGEYVTETGYLEANLTDKTKMNLITHNLNIPLMFKYKASDKFSLLAGPYASIRLGSSFKANDFLNARMSYANYNATANELLTLFNNMYQNQTKSFDAGIALGMEYKVTEKLFVDVRYSLSFLNTFIDKLDTKDFLKSGLTYDMYLYLIENEIYEDYTQDEIKEYITENFEGASISNLLGGNKITLRNSYIQIGVGYRF